MLKPGRTRPVPKHKIEKINGTQGIIHRLATVATLESEMANRIQVVVNLNDINQIKDKSDESKSTTIYIIAY